MRTTKALTITLPEEMARAVKERVASGAYASESEVIREGLRALAAQDAAVEHWLRTEGVARYEAYLANPDNTLSADELSASLQRRIPQLHENPMKIMLQQILQIPMPSEYKLHFARYNGSVQPLDVWMRDKCGWLDWQKNWGEKNNFTRKYIFSTIDFYIEEDTWLFGGIFESETLKLDKGTEALIGRLKLKYKYVARQKSVFLEKHYDRIEVSEIFRAPFAG